MLCKMCLEISQRVLGPFDKTYFAMHSDLKHLTFLPNQLTYGYWRAPNVQALGLVVSDRRDRDPDSIYLHHKGSCEIT